MKHLKWFSLFLAFSLLCGSFCGCAPGASREPLELLRSAKFVTASDGDLLFTMEWSETGGTFRFSAPELLQPMTVQATGENLSASYKGLKTEITEEFCAGILPLYRAFQAFRSSGAENGIQGEQPFLRASLGGETFSMYYDPKSEVFTRLEWTGERGSGGLDIVSCSESTP